MNADAPANRQMRNRMHKHPMQNSHLWMLSWNATTHSCMESLLTNKKGQSSHGNIKVCYFVSSGASLEGAAQVFWVCICRWGTGAGTGADSGVNGVISLPFTKKRPEISAQVSIYQAFPRCCRIQDGFLRQSTTDRTRTVADSTV